MVRKRRFAAHVELQHGLREVTDKLGKNCDVCVCVCVCVCVLGRSEDVSTAELRRLRVCGCDIHADDHVDVFEGLRS